MFKSYNYILLFLILINFTTTSNGYDKKPTPSSTDNLEYEVDISWDFDDGDRQGWGNATVEEMQMEVRVEHDELRASIVGHYPNIDSPPMYLDITRRHYVVIRMMYYGSADSAQLMLKSGAREIKRDRIDYSRSYWTFPQNATVINDEHNNTRFAVDDNLNTLYTSTTNNNNIIDLDLHESRWISAVELWPIQGSASPKRCYLQRSRIHSTGPYETVGDFVVKNDGKKQWFGGINAYGKYWRFLIMTNHGSESTSIYEIKLHGADEDISIADFESNNILDNTGLYKNYYIPINQFLSGSLLRMRMRMFRSSSLSKKDNSKLVRSHMQYREGLAIDYIRVVRAPEIWRVRGCLDRYSDDINFGTSTFNVEPILNMINNHLPLKYFDKKFMDLQYAKTYDCPIEGGVNIRIDGLNFGPHARIFIGSGNKGTSMNYGSSHEEDDGRGNECIRIDDTEYESSFSRDPTNERIESIICKLPPGTPGSKLVRVENGKLPGIFQQVPMFSYRNAPPVMKRPTITNIASHRVDLVWTPPGDAFDHNMVTGYKVLWFQPQTPNVIHNLTVGNVTTTSVRGLRPDSEYVFSIAAVAEGAYNEKSANLPTDLYGRRDLTGNAMVGTFSAYTNVTATLLYDIDFAGFDANKTTNSSGNIGTDEMKSNGPTGSFGSEGHYGIVLVGSANVQNCNGSSTCCDGYNATIGDSSCGLVCAVFQSKRLAYDNVIDGVTRRQVPSNIPYEKEGDQEKVITTYEELVQTQGASLPSSRCGPALRLTPSEARQSGSAWYNRKMNVREGFETTFKFEISNPSLRCDRLDDVNTYCRSRGADGLAFVLQNESPIALGKAGSGIGYEGINNSFAIELDTYMNYDNMDPYENHISVLTQGWRYNITSNHSRSLADTTRIPDLTDGIHTVRIKYDPNFDMDAVPHPSFQTSGYTTWFLENADFKYGGEGDWGTGFGLLYVYVDDLYSPVLTTPLNLESTLKMDDGRMYVGLTSATGNSNWQVHDVLEWQFRSLHIDRLYEAPVVVNGEGAHECRNETACVHTPEYEHFMRTNNIQD